MNGRPPIFLRANTVEIVSRNVRATTAEPVDENQRADRRDSDVAMTPDEAEP